MKYMLVYMLIFVLSSCDNYTQKIKTNIPDTHNKNHVKPDSKMKSDIISAKNDTVNISTIPTDTFYESKHDLDKMLKYYPEFKDDITQTPDIAYATRSSTKQALNDDYYFGSEAGQDSYYILYAYFLKQKTGYQDNSRRENLVKMFRDINQVYMRLRGGGTYFGHTYKRILGYAEYSIDTYNYKKKNIMS